MLKGCGLLARTLLMAMVLALGACTEVEFASDAYKRFRTPEDRDTRGHYKVGEPYQVAGVWYYPKVDLEYRETGIASWYGPGFHGRRTANGEVYDQDGLTAAHRTLPMPSMVRITNLENGRSIVVRVNDRGPFKHGRIIDLSHRGAQLLGFLKKGTAKVEVQILETESRQAAAVAQSRDTLADAPEPAPVVPVVMASLPADGSDGTVVAPLAPPAPEQPSRFATRQVVEPRPDGKVTRQVVNAGDIYIQAGAFLHRDNARRLSSRLADLGETSISAKRVNDKVFYRVRLGPLRSVAAADRLLASLITKGFTDAAVVVD
jgi:rare lipoprotein A